MPVNFMTIGWTMAWQFTLLSPNHVGAVKRGPVFCMRCECDAPYYMSCSVRMDSRAVCVWTAKKQKRKYISGIAAMTAGQILVIIIFPFLHPSVPVGGIARIWPRLTLNRDTGWSNFRRSPLSRLLANLAQI